MTRPTPFMPALIAIFAALTACAPTLAAPARPVVVELFTSQGCSSCPPAHAVLNTLADRPDVLALSFAVTYWDNLGWKDSFGDPAYTARQWAYAKGLHHDNVYTPQMVIDGAHDTTGQSLQQVEPLIRTAAAHQKPGPSVVINGDHVTIAAMTGAPQAIVWLVRYDPRTQNVAIGRGENSGRTLPQRNVVRQLVRLGDWHGTTADFHLLKASDAHYRTAILVQQGDGGPIITAATL
ncbi:DUF1223 domain-containing protein [Asticcacaulis sp. EMRT-3]|uniref:DUF1223 domain-containing protein n=1 Tax=Asticcacaulis sp. EMRT-3 TaxID=3040349 RepID=UPI0024AF3588|nr:DUF1223 domain-containing protein [Asticcacaulis sp. EMRT-3]MDI7774387.1 DUF1223 domain-containing protein [Asticcacaulis sp. EMRT-3]